jgi:hypothetical protein
MNDLRINNIPTFISHWQYVSEMTVKAVEHTMKAVGSAPRHLFLQLLWPWIGN